MKRTTLCGTSLYADMMISGKKVYIFKVFGFWPHEITHDIIRIDSLNKDAQTNMRSAISTGVLGTLIAGPIGALVGVAMARKDTIGYYRLTFRNTFPEHMIEVVTRDQALIAYFDRWANKPSSADLFVPPNI